MTSMPLLAQLASVALSYATNSISGTLTNQDMVVGTNSTVLALANSNARRPDGTPATSLTNGQIFIVPDELGWGHQFVATGLSTASQGFNSFVPASAAYQMQTNLPARTNGLTVAARSLFSTQVFATTNFVPNPNFWLKFAPERTAMVVAQGTPPIGIIGGSAVTPRHVINCAHAPYSAGLNLFFVGSDGVVVSRSVVASVYLGSNDVQCALLSADLPATVTPFKVLPADFRNQLPSAAIGHLQLVGGNQFQQMVPKAAAISQTSVTALSDPAWGAWNASIIAGDSGHPIAALIQTNLVLVSHWWWSGGGPSYADSFNAINAKLHYLSTNNGLASDYQLTPVSLSAWPTY